MPRLVGSTITATFVVVACNVLPSCSPYIYSSDVAQLSTWTSSIDASSQQTASAITNQQYQNNRYDWIQQRRTLTVGPGCGLNYTGPVACEIVSGSPDSAVALKDATRPVSSARSIDVCEISQAAISVNADRSRTKQKPATIDEIAALLRALDNYTAGLAAVTKAQDRADFDTAAGKLSAPWPH
jgi:hypothetical protein